MPGTPSEALAMQGEQRRTLNRERMQSARQRTAAASNISSADDQEAPDKDNIKRSTSRGIRARLTADKKSSKEFREQAKKQVEAYARRVAKKAADKVGIRVVNAIFGATGFGLVVTFFIMLGQCFFGNMMGIKGVTKLSGLEIGILVGIGGLLFFLYIFITMVVGLFSDPWKAGITALSSAIESLFD